MHSQLFKGIRYSHRRRGAIAFKDPQGFGFGGDFSIRYKVNIDSGGGGADAIQGKIVNSLKLSADFSEPQTNAINNMLRSYHVMTVVQANGKMTLRFNGQQQAVNSSGFATNVDFLLDDTADGSSDAGKFITPEFVIYTLNDTTSFSDVINIENTFKENIGLPSSRSHNCLDMFQTAVTI